MKYLEDLHGHSGSGRLRVRCRACVASQHKDHEYAELVSRTDSPDHQPIEAAEQSHRYQKLAQRLHSGPKLLTEQSLQCHVSNRHLETA